MSPPHPAAIPEHQLLKDCAVRRGRRRGPGGQHRNKVETAVVIVHSASGTKGEASERRSQEQNRRTAVFRLRVNLALQLRLARTPETMPSDLWKSRCISGRVQVSPTHDDFPALLAEALDALQASDVEVKTAAELLGCSVSQLVKFLKLEPRGLQRVNEWREENGMHRLS